MARPVGWRKDPARHALAAKGVPTKLSAPSSRQVRHPGLEKWGGLMHPRNVAEWEQYGYDLANDAGVWGFDKNTLFWTEADVGKEADESVLTKAATLVADAEEGPVLMKLAMVVDEDYQASKAAFVKGYTRAARATARKLGRNV